MPELQRVNARSHGVIQLGNGRLRRIGCAWVGRRPEDSVSVIFHVDAVKGATVEVRLPREEWKAIAEAIAADQQPEED